MARVTVEDCVVRVPNRFELVMMAAQRSREITAGAPLTVDQDNDKNPVVALREIADGTVSLDQVRDALIRSRQRHVEMEEPEEEVIELMAGEEDWLRNADARERDERSIGDPFESLDEADLAGFADDDLGPSEGDEQPLVEDREPLLEEGEAADFAEEEAGAEEADLADAVEAVGEDVDGVVIGGLGEDTEEDTGDDTGTADIGEDAGDDDLNR